jgi:hypothetical protein
VICKDDEDGGTLDDNFIAQIEDKRLGSIKIVESGKGAVVLKRDLLIFHSLFISILLYNQTNFITHLNNPASTN